MRDDSIPWLAIDADHDTVAEQIFEIRGGIYEPGRVSPGQR